MAKVALLIGVSQYKSHLIKPLAGVVKDIEAMQRVLQHPNIGYFDEVKPLIDCDCRTTHLEIERLFTEQRQTDDLVLLYLSGHGFRDENGYLYFVTHDTEMNLQRQVFTGTAVSARFIQEQCMNRSQSKRQILILDCCFSGAFAEGMSAKDLVPAIDIDIAAQLGGEGRAVLTSSTATQVSLEDQGGGVYTQYLIEGIEKGTADTDDDGVITVAELHDYAKRKVQEAKPAMKPEIYAVREGYTIRLAKAPVGDPKLEYRKEVERCVRKDGSFSAVGRGILSRRQRELRLTPEEASEIAEEVLKPFREYQQSLQEYEQVLVEMLQEEPVLSDETWEELKRFQQILKLRDEDVAPIHERLTPPATERVETRHGASLQSLSVNKSAYPSSIEANRGTEEDDLSSEKGIDYTKLRDLLAAKNWKEADHETYLVMIQAVGKKDGDWFTENELLNFPCTDLRTIDRLWVKYSNGHFGFSIQKEIYLSVGGKADGKYYKEAWEKFGDRVGWRVNSSWIMEVTFDTSALRGHLPRIRDIRHLGGFRMCSLLSHRDL